ncbi:actin [Pelomyxa schiedti]|nr:actin [Pelomyxa schiedti]
MFTPGRETRTPDDVMSESVPVPTTKPLVQVPPREFHSMLSDPDPCCHVRHHAQVQDVLKQVGGSWSESRIMEEKNRQQQQQQQQQQQPKRPRAFPGSSRIPPLGFEKKDLSHWLLSNEHDGKDEDEGEGAAKLGRASAAAPAPPESCVVRDFVESCKEEKATGTPRSVEAARDCDYGSGSSHNSEHPPMRNNQCPPHLNNPPHLENCTQLTNSPVASPVINTVVAPPRSPYGTSVYTSPQTSPTNSLSLQQRAQTTPIYQSKAPRRKQQPARNPLLLASDSSHQFLSNSLGSTASNSNTVPQTSQLTPTTQTQTPPKSPISPPLKEALPLIPLRSMPSQQVAPERPEHHESITAQQPLHVHSSLQLHTQSSASAYHRNARSLGSASSFFRPPIANSVIVVDPGSGAFKVGHAGHDRFCPEVQFPISSFSNVEVGPTIYRGDIFDTERMNSLLEHSFQELKIDPSEKRVLLADSPMNKKRDRIVTEMFEKHGIAGLAIESQGALSLLAMGKQSGVAVESGYGVTFIVPMFNGKIQGHAVKRLELGGNDLTEYFQKLLLQRNNFSRTQENMVAINEAKERLCCLPDLPTTSTSDTAEDIFHLPDSKAIRVSSAKYQVPEALFFPRVLSCTLSFGIHNMVHFAIQDCSHEFRRDLYRNIVLSGGNSLFPHLDARLKAEVSKLAPTELPSVVPAPDAFSSWRGGSVLGAMSSFHDKVVLRKEYEEEGVRVVRKFM